VPALDGFEADPSASRPRPRTPVFELFGAAGAQQLPAGVLEGIYSDLAAAELINPEVAARDDYKAPS